jgi:hypothetical protein
MNKLALLGLLLMSSQSFAALEYTGELVENETSFKELCTAIKSADDRCANADDFILAGVLLPNDEAVNVAVKKSEFPSIEGKKVRARFDLPNPIGTVVEVL